MPATLRACNSTIVRSKISATTAVDPGRDRETARSVALALGLWAVFVVLGAQAGVFARLGGEPYAALVAFATLYSAAIVVVDRRLRAWLAGRARTVASLGATGAVALLVAAGSGAETIAVASPLGATLLLLGLPLTAALCTAAGTALAADSAR
jgi:hypothetical protein